MKTCAAHRLLETLPLLLLIGCANEVSRPPTAEIRARIGRVAVEAAPSATQNAMAKPYTRGQAAAATAMEMLQGREVGLLLMPLGAAVGAMYGTPSDEIEAGATVMTNACAGVDFQRTFRRDVVAAIGRHTRNPVVPAGRSGKHPGANSVLELNVIQAGLAGNRYKGSKLGVFMQVHARLKSLPDGTEIYRKTWHHQGGAQRTFKEWTAQGGTTLRREFAITSRELAEKLVREVFVGLPSSKEDWFARDTSRTDRIPSLYHGNWNSARDVP